MIWIGMIAGATLMLFIEVLWIALYTRRRGPIVITAPDGPASSRVLYRHAYQTGYDQGQLDMLEDEVGNDN